MSPGIWNPLKVAPSWESGDVVWRGWPAAGAADHLSSPTLVVRDPVVGPRAANEEPLRAATVLDDLFGPDLGVACVLLQGNGFQPALTRGWSISQPACFRTLSGKALKRSLLISVQFMPPSTERYIRGSIWGSIE